MLQTSRANVIEVDFAARRRVRPPSLPLEASPPPAALSGLGRAAAFLVFWRPPALRTIGEYLGGRWDWGWTVFVWTSEAAVGPVWHHLVDGRGYVPQRLTRQGFVSFLQRSNEVGGLLLDGELDGNAQVIQADPEQLIGRREALGALGRR